MYYPTSIKDTIQWFTFPKIVEHTANILKPNKGLITSLLKVFVMFELSLVYERDKVESIAIMCVNSKKGTGLYLRTPTLE